MLLKKLIPYEVWQYFEEICQIPRASKKEQFIIEYLLQFGRNNHLQTKRDEAGNILITKNATHGMENIQTVVLQSHIDMVCEKDSSVTHNFDTDPIVPYVEQDWIKAHGTTLGADDGIGIAAQLAILASDDIQHGPLECLFTVDEETGLTGAYQLTPGFFKGKILLNLDSEDEGIIFTGCAGGMDTTGIVDVEREAVLPDNSFFRLSIAGLKGGHSGDDIGKGLGNSIKIVTRILWEGLKIFNISIGNIGGGNLKNAIPREAYAEIAIPISKKNVFEKFLSRLSNQIREELLSNEPHLRINIKSIQPFQTALQAQDAKKILNILYALPHGVILMSKKIEGLVETSTNLASVKSFLKNQFEICTSQRSSSDTLKTDIAQKVACSFNLANVKVNHSTGYPGWNPNPDSHILNIAKKSYYKLFGKQPVITAVHAGLECGLFLTKYPELDMISFGPDIKGAHSPDERINIKSVDKFWQLLIEILKNIPSN